MVASFSFMNRIVPIGLDIYSTGTNTPAQPSCVQDPSVEIHPSPTHDGVLIKVRPPVAPTNQDGADGAHVPCDIVLVIDVSYSMSEPAPAMSVDDCGATRQERTGFTVLDITKHAALTVLETMNDGDRLGIVTFSTTSKVIQRLLPMTKSNKKMADQNIRALKPENSTNLWGGIVDALKLFNDKKDSGRVPAVMVLTDGQPNTGAPLTGYIPAIRAMNPLPAVIHTFSFGYDIQSGLLKSISEVSCGDYSFIPDSGMVGTVFVNTVAHLQSTFATRCVLELSAPDTIELETTAGQTVSPSGPKGAVLSTAGTETHSKRTTAIDLGNIQYGQSRDIFLRYSSKSPSITRLAAAGEDTTLVASLRYNLMTVPQYVVSTTHDLRTASLLPASELSYHRSRSALCAFISTLLPLAHKEVHATVSPTSLADRRALYAALLSSTRVSADDDPRSGALAEDITGQVRLAIDDPDHFKRWGRHFLLSLWSAHAKQLRNTFKDPGVQVYNADSPLFLRCQARLVHAFDTAVTPPEPSDVDYDDGEHKTRVVAGGGQGQSQPLAARRVVDMAMYNRSDYPCFAGGSPVALASGLSVPVSSLRKGALVMTPRGSRRVVAVLKTPVTKIMLCRLGDEGLAITPWHPIRQQQPSENNTSSDCWVFPKDVVAADGRRRMVRYSGAIYSLLLQPDRDPDAHAVRVGGVWATTLGHGITTAAENGGADDVRAHAFLGDYRRVSKALVVMGVGRDGLVMGRGVKREKTRGHMCGFKRARRGGIA